MKTEKTRFTIGRERTCDIPIADDSVSRLHAELSLLEGGKLFLTDCHSSNGTLLLRDGQSRRVAQEVVQPTDHIQFGSVVLSMSDILASIVTLSPAAGRMAPKADTTPPAGARVRRCECGAIKPEGKRCPACGI
ncbi:MAG: FHA domain-containing protein [Bryobacterales bacterium]|nr:FHA domain-containing protein [Bryobacterales bacterium]